MKVIISSMPKGGTKSLAAAMKVLGYKVYDYEEQIYYLSDKLLKLMETGCTTEEIYEIFKDVDVISDVPACTFWEEILRAFPDVKIIHTERENEDVWVKSYNNQLSRVTDNVLLHIISLVTPSGRKLRKYFNATTRCQFGMDPMIPFTKHRRNFMLFKMRYREHNARVREVVPAEQILYHNIKDGWGPLCNFLKLPIPTEPFPHKNKDGGIVEEIMKNSPIFVKIRNELLIMLASLASIVSFYFYYCRKW